MSLFKPQKPVLPSFPEPKVIEDNIPVVQFDLSKRYDLYCCIYDENRIYENVKIIGLRTLERRTEFSSGTLGAYLEVEAADGTRCFVPQFHISSMCEHGAPLVYQVIKKQM